MAQMVVLIVLVLAVVEGFIDRGEGAPCIVAGSPAPGFLFAGAVLAILILSMAGGLTG